MGYKLTGLCLLYTLTANGEVVLLDDEQLAKDLNDEVLSNMGFGPVSDFLEFNLTVEGIERNNKIEILPNGIRFFMPKHIDKIYLEDIRIKGDELGSSFGSIYMTDIDFSDSNYTISY